MRMWFVYALCDPVTLEPQYVGWSYDPASRLGSHWNYRFKYKTRKNYWLRSLERRGEAPMTTDEIVAFWFLMAIHGETYLIGTVLWGFAEWLEN